MKWKIMFRLIQTLSLSLSLSLSLFLSLSLSPCFSFCKHGSITGPKRSTFPGTTMNEDFSLQNQKQGKAKAKKKRPSQRIIIVFYLFSGRLQVIISTKSLIDVSLWLICLNNGWSRSSHETVLKIDSQRAPQISISIILSSKLMFHKLCTI